MRRVDRVAPVDAADRDHVDRRRAPSRACGSARARSPSAAPCLLVEEQGRARRAGRMPFGEAERVEVVAGRLDLAAVDDLVAEAEEDVLDVAADERGRVQRAARPQPRRAEQPRRQRDVGALGLQARVELRPLELGLRRLDRLLDRLPGGVQRHPGLAVAHLAERELQRALASEVVDAHVVELGERPCRGDGGDSFVLDCLRIHGGDCIRPLRRRFRSSGSKRRRPPRAAHLRRVRLRPDRAPLRPVEHERDRGRLVLRRRGARRGRPRRRARRRHGPHRDPDGAGRRRT